MTRAVLFDAPGPPGPAGPRGPAGAPGPIGPTGPTFNVVNYGAKADGSTSASDAITKNWTSIQAACDACAAFGGGIVFIPAGTYDCGNLPISVGTRTLIVGEGKVATIIYSRSSSHIFEQLCTINGSTPVWGGVRDIRVSNANAANTGAGVYQRAGTFFDVINVGVEFAKYGILFDQTEVGNIDLCELEACKSAGVWLTNGSDFSTSASGGFTNQVSVSRCHFNSCLEYGLVDDGGGVHTILQNNFENNTTADARLAGVTGLNFSSNSHEGSPYSIIFAAVSSVLGAATGACSGEVKKNSFAHSGGTNCINMLAGSSLDFGNNEYSGAGTYAIINAVNCSQLRFSAPEILNGPTVLTDSEPSFGSTIGGGFVYNGINTSEPTMPWDVKGAQGTRADTITLANGDNNDIPLPANKGTSFMRVGGPTSSFSIGGIVALGDGQDLVIFNPLSQTMTIKNEDTSSTAAHRITTLTGADIVKTAASPSSAHLKYDAGSSRWIVIG